MRKRKKKVAEKLLTDLTIKLAEAFGVDYDEDEIKKMAAECVSSAKDELNLEETEDQ